MHDAGRETDAQRERKVSRICLEVFGHLSRGGKIGEMCRHREVRELHRVLVRAGAERTVCCRVASCCWIEAPEASDLRILFESYHIDAMLKQGFGGSKT
jgi:hypothetical protein